MDQNRDLIGADVAGTLHGLFARRAERTPDAIAYRYVDREDGRWKALTWAEMAARVRRFRLGLAAERLRPGDRVGMVLRNGIDWVAFEQAALAQGLVVVPTYPDDRPDNVAYIIAETGLRVLLVQDASRWQRLAPAVASVDAMPDRVLVLGEGPALAAPARYVADWLPPDGPAPAPAVAEPGDLATIVYTSGTAGRPKGVMLSHRNILADAESGLSVFAVRGGDCFLSFLPLPHMFERTVGYYLAMMAGAEVAFARSIQQLAQDFQAVRPTIIIAVPRIFETLYGRIQQQLEGAPAWRRRLFRLALEVGWRRFLRGQGRAGWAPRLLAGPLLQALVGRKVLERLGGRLRIAVSGGAALPLEVARLFIGLGLPVCQGYGLTEASPAVCFNPPEDNDPATIGRVLPGIEVGIGADEELLVRGATVMLGYWRDPEATARAIDAEGWLHTGDQARIEDGRVRITGRIKDILVLSNGEKVPPAEMETVIALDPLFEQVLVVGEGRPFLALLVVLNAEVWTLFCDRHRIDPSARSLGDRRVQHLLLERVASRLHAFPGHAKVRRVHATLDAWTIDNGLVTPTLKLKRAVVLRRFAAEVDELYRGE